MEDKRTSLILYVIATLLAINLLGTFWLINKVSEQPSKLVSKSKHQEDLPDYLTKEVRKEIYKEFEEAFNSRDPDSFWYLFSDLARSSMNINETKKTYNNLLDLFGEVSNGVFTYHEFLETHGNLRTFSLHYNVDLSEEAKFGNKGEVIIVITDDGEEYGILRTTMNMRE